MNITTLFEDRINELIETIENRKALSKGLCYTK